MAHIYRQINQYYAKHNYKLKTKSIGNKVPQLLENKMISI